MKATAVALAEVLWYGVLTIWVEERWAWSLCQAAVFALAALRILSPTPIRFERPAVPLAAAAMWPLIQLSFGATVSRFETRSAALDWFTFLVIFALACDSLREEPARRWFIAANVLFGALLALIATLQHYAAPALVLGLFASGFSGDVFGPFVYRNQFAAWLELLLPLALWKSLADVRLKALWATAAVVMYAAMVSSTSRAGVLFASLEVVLVLAAAAARPQTDRKSLATQSAQFVVLAALATAVVGWHALATRWTDSGPENLRADAVRACIQMTRDHPWTGTGLGTWRQIYPRYAGFDTGLEVNQAHNDWAQWASEGGLPFLSFLLIFAALLWKPALRSIYGLGTVVFLAHALVDYPMQQRPALAAWLFAIAGATVASYDRSAGPHDLLRRTRRRTGGIAGRDSAGVQTSRPAGPSGSLQRRVSQAPGGTADEAIERNRRVIDGSGRTGPL